MIGLALRLAGVFFKIGLFTLGGGLAIIALVQQEMLGRGWLSAAEFSDILGIAQSTPGPIGVNTATFTGFRVFANQGAPVWMAVAASALATLSVMVPSVVGVALGGSWFERHRGNFYVSSVFKLLRPCVAGFVCAAGIVLSRDCFVAASAASSGFPLRDGLLFVFALWCAFTNRYSPLLPLGLGVLAGLASA